MEYNNIYLCDFLDNDLPDKCANLIIADPPYYKTKGAFDFIFKDFDEYLFYVDKWAIECERLLADNGNLLWYGSSKNIAYSQIILDKYFTLINNLVWYKGKNFMGLNKSKELRSFAPCTERILLYGKKEIDKTGLEFIKNDNMLFLSIREYIDIERKKIPYTLTQLNKMIFGYDNGKDGVAGNKLSPYKKNWQFPDEANYNKIRNWCKSMGINAFLREYEDLRMEYEDLRMEYEDLRRPFNNIYELNEVLIYDNEQHKSKKYNHDTIKPEKMTFELINTLTNMDGVVVVPFCGSGTECAMAKKAGRKYIGYDIEPNYVSIAKDRCNQINDLFITNL